MFPEQIALDDYAEKAGKPLERDRPFAENGQASFEQIFEQYRSMVFNLTLRILGDREEALDVSQEVFLTVYRKMNDFRGESSLKTWVYRIAVNRASNRCRWWNRLRRRGTVSLDEHLGRMGDQSLLEKLESRGASPEQALLAQEKSAEIERTLLLLPIQQRVAVVMRDIEGMSYEEIAESTDTSLGTVKSRIARGRDFLKRNLNGALG